MEPDLPTRLEEPEGLTLNVVPVSGPATLRMPLAKVTPARSWRFSRASMGETQPRVAALAELQMRLAILRPVRTTSSASVEIHAALGAPGTTLRVIAL